MCNVVYNVAEVVVVNGPSKTKCFIEFHGSHSLIFLAAMSVLHSHFFFTKLSWIPDFWISGFLISVCSYMY